SSGGLRVAAHVGEVEFINGENGEGGFALAAASRALSDVAERRAVAMIDAGRDLETAVAAAVGAAIDAQGFVGETRDPILVASSERRAEDEVVEGSGEGGH